MTGLSSARSSRALPGCEVSRSSVRLIIPKNDMALEAKVAVPRGEEERLGASDRELLDALERRESWAAAALYDKLTTVVERTLFRVLQRRGPDFEDLVQVTFERIVRTLLEHRFAANCKLTTWATAIATNVAIDAVRSRIRERRVFSEESVELADRHSVPPSATERMEVRAEVLRVQRVLASMNAEQAEAILLHDVIGHNLAEVAVIVGVTVAAAQSRLVRGRKEFLRRAKQLDAGGKS